MKLKLLFVLALVVLLVAAPVFSLIASADGPSDEGLYASYMCRGGLGPAALQWFTTQYGLEHPGLDWAKATPHILNAYCGYQVVNTDTLQASWVVRVYAPYLRAAYGGVSTTSK